MNSLEDALIIERVQYLVLKLIAAWDVVFLPDYIDIPFRGYFSTGRLQLKDGTFLALYEEYTIFNYRLVITRYAYIWYDANGEELLRADNREHHPDVSTSPHHIHDFRFRRKRAGPFHKQDSANPDITEFFAWMRGERR